MSGLWRLARPLFLLGGVVLYGLGVVIARAQGVSLDPTSIALGQLTVTFGQLLTHFTNDYHDRVADAANSTPTRWSGGSRALVEGRVSPEDARRAAWLAGGSAAVAGGALSLRADPALPLAMLVGLALFLAWAYSSPPIRLHARGLGEVAGAILLAAITPAVGLLAAGGRPTAAIWLSLGPLVLLQFAMLVAVSLPDRLGDAAAGKQTLAVRLGGAAAGRVAAGAILAAFLWAAMMWVGGGEMIGRFEGGMVKIGGGMVVLGYLFWLPVGMWVARRLVHGWDDTRGWEALGFWSIGLVMGSALGMAAWWWWWWLE